MKKLVILLIAVLAIGAAAIYMLENHADLQVALPTSYAKTEDEGEKFVPGSDWKTEDWKTGEQ